MGLTPSEGEPQTAVPTVPVVPTPEPVLGAPSPDAHPATATPADRLLEDAAEVVAPVVSRWLDRLAGSVVGAATAYVVQLLVQHHIL